MENEYLKDKKYRKVRDHHHYTWEYRGAAHSVCNLNIPTIFHNGSNYDYHFIKTKLAEEFKKQFTSLEANT